MSQYPIAVVVGSLRRDSINRKLATAIAKLAPPEFSFNQIEIGDLPHYNQDDDGTPAESVKRLKGEIKSASGVLFVTAEYNRSVPGVLKMRSTLPRALMAKASGRASRPVCWGFDRGRRHSDGAAAFA